MKDFFLCHFPIPNFLKMPSVGIDISDGSVRFVELVDKGCKKTLGRFGRIDLPEGVVHDGEIKNKIELIKILKKIKKENNFNFIRASIIEKNSYIFRTKVNSNENVDREEILGSLNFKLEENVPIKPADAVFDFDILKKNKDNLDVVVSVLPKRIAEQFVEVFEEVGLIPLSFEVEAQAVARSSVLKGDRDAYMIVDFRNTRVSISIVSGGLVQLTSTLDIGGDDLISAIRKSLDISSEEAQKIKKEKGFSKVNYEDNLFYSMLSTVSALKDEINKYLIYWHTHKDNVTSDKKIKSKVKKIILCGQNAGLKGLDDYLSLGIGIKVEKADVWKNIFSFDDFIPEMDFSKSLEYAAAIGLAIRTNDEKLD
ncbi:pilus assembly protein PilM [Patescibacteria group bacterium]|nr:pilus assembly protein PilM [Patescibacteria group bacterium]